MQKAATDAAALSVDEAPQKAVEDAAAKAVEDAAQNTAQDAAEKEENTNSTNPRSHEFEN